MKLLRKGYDVATAKEVAASFVGTSKISFVAIDGTKAQDKELDMLLFYSGSFAYMGNLNFIDNGCQCGEVIEADSSGDVSTAIPLYEEDASIVVGQETEGGLEIDPEKLPSNLMHLSEYYLAIKTIKDNPDLKLVILDRTLAGDVASKKTESFLTVHLTIFRLLLLRMHSVVPVPFGITCSW